MLGRASTPLALLACLASASLGADFELAYDTGHPNGPDVLDLDTPTPVTISVVNNTAADFPIGGIVFDFSSTGHPLSWDLDGPDDIGGDPVTNPGPMADNDFAWTSWLDGSTHPLMSMPAYFATVDPPQTALPVSDFFAVTVPAGGVTHVATLTVTASAAPGSGAWQSELRVGVVPDLLYAGEAGGFAGIPDLGGTEVIRMVPEPATVALLLIGSLAALRRQSQRGYLYPLNAPIAASWVTLGGCPPRVPTDPYVRD